MMDERADHGNHGRGTRRFLCLVEEVAPTANMKKSCRHKGNIYDQPGLEYPI